MQGTPAPVLQYLQPGGPAVHPDDDHSVTALGLLQEAPLIASAAIATKEGASVSWMRMGDDECLEVRWFSESTSAAEV